MIIWRSRKEQTRKVPNDQRKSGKKHAQKLRVKGQMKLTAVGYYIQIRNQFTWFNFFFLFIIFVRFYFDKYPFHSHFLFLSLSPFFILLYIWQYNI